MRARTAPLRFQQVTTELRKAIEAHARREFEPDQQVQMFLSDGTGLRPYRVARFQTCQPAMLHSERLAARLAAESRALGVRQYRRVGLWVHVSADAHATEVRVRQGSGDIRVDQAAVGILERSVFTPAQIEGIPMDLWVQFPVTFLPASRIPRSP